MSTDQHLFIFGPGYTGQTVAQKALGKGWSVTGTYRQAEKAAALSANDISPVAFGSDDMLDAMNKASHWLISIAPSPDGDPALDFTKSRLKQLKGPKWVGYLSSTNVYGNHDGAWVNEQTAPSPGLDRGKRRVAAEQAWQQLAADMGATCHIFRLAGIYGPGRNAVRSLLDGKARRIIKPGQLFSRIHVDDIAQAVLRAMELCGKSDIFNLADDTPCPPQDVITEAATLLGVTPPPEISFEDADLSPMARSFYMESKRVRNDHVKAALGLELKYPSFRKALPDLVRHETKAE